MFLPELRGHPDTTPASRPAAYVINLPGWS